MLHACMHLSKQGYDEHTTKTSRLIENFNVLLQCQVAWQVSMNISESFSCTHSKPFVTSITIHNFPTRLGTWNLSFSFACKFSYISFNFLPVVHMHCIALHTTIAPYIYTLLYNIESTTSSLPQ